MNSILHDITKPLSKKTLARKTVKRFRLECGAPIDYFPFGALLELRRQKDENTEAEKEKKEAERSEIDIAAEKKKKAAATSET